MRGAASRTRLAAAMLLAMSSAAAAHAQSIIQHIKAQAAKKVRPGRAVRAPAGSTAASSP
jgi:hypothetical protein